MTSVDKLCSVGWRRNGREALVEWYWQRKTEVLGTEMSQCNLAITMTWILLGLNPGLCSGRQVTNRVSYGTTSLNNLRVNHVNNGVNVTCAESDSGWTLVAWVHNTSCFPFSMVQDICTSHSINKCQYKRPTANFPKRSRQLLPSFHISSL